LDVEDRPWFLSLSVMLNALEIAGPPGPGAHYDPFFAFLHFADPDIAGHYRGDKIDYTYYGDTENIAPNVLANWIYHFEGTLPHGGENSKLYEMAIKKCDDCLGEIVAKLEELGIRDETEIYVTSDHGFDEEGATYPINSLFPDRIGHTHIMAPYVFLATDDPTVIRAGNQFDIAPTILKRFGIDISVYGTEKCTCPYCMYPDPNGPERCPRFPGKSLSEPKPAWTWDKWRP
jgi:arylsulfatase A-like enzyme